MTMTDTPVTDQATHPAVKADAEKTHSERFKFSRWVHVGEDAESCAHATDGKCKYEAHFHAWIRLPNPYQIRDITEKAQAARARRMRALRDPESDVRIIMEDELQTLQEASKELLADEIEDKFFADDYRAATREVMDLPDEGALPAEGLDGGEDGEVPKLYVNIDQDREEYERQRLLPEEQREEGFAELEKRLADYGRAIEEELKQIQEPRRARLMERSVADLIDVIRRDRMEANATEAYLHTFFTWQAYACTFRGTASGTPNQRYWSRIEQMKFEEPPEVIMALRSGFDSLESNLAATRQGKGS